MQTDYPFEDEVRISVETEFQDAWSMYLRIPGWSTSPRVTVDGEAVAGIQAGQFLRMARVWFGRHEIVMRFGMKVRVERRENGSIAVHRGPLVYAMQVGEEWKHVKGELPAGDFEVWPTTAWNVAVVMDAAEPDRGWRFEEREVGDVPFSGTAPANVMVGKGVVLKEWGLVKNAADLPPASPVVAAGKEVEVRLVPYGCARLRVCEMPWLKQQ